MAVLDPRAKKPPMTENNSTNGIKGFMIFSRLRLIRNLPIKFRTVGNVQNLIVAGRFISEENLVGISQINAIPA